MRVLRPRLALVATLLLAAACGFGVDLDGIIGGGPSDAATTVPDAATLDARVEVVEPGEPTDSGTSDSDSGGSDAGDASIPALELLQIGAGNAFTCVLKSNKTVACWGRGTEGRLGNNGTLSSSVPVPVLDMNDAVDLSVGYNHACVVRATGGVYCWGANDLRQLGLGTATPEQRTPQAVPGIANAKQVAAGLGFTCALVADGTVSCWGTNSDGQVGDGTVIQRQTAVAVANLKDVKQIGVSITAACALTNGGEVWCWGDNQDGQSGSGDAGASDLTTPRKIETLKDVASIARGGSADHLCVVLANGEPRCWGYGDTGCLGNGVAVDSATPIAPINVTGVASIATGNGFTCTAKVDGKTMCWGSTFWKTIPLASPPPNPSIPLETLPKGVTAIAGGVLHACAIVDKRSVQCWGTDQFGALGRKRAITFDKPVLANANPKPTVVAAGREYVCGLESPDGGSLACWGINSNRQQARTDFVISGNPSVIPSITGVTRVAPSETHTCAVITDGGVRCWGQSDNLALGFVAATTPTPTPGVFVAPPAQDVGTGQSFSCAHLRDGRVMCAGSSLNGQLGRGGLSSATPQHVSLDGGAASIFEGVDQLSVGRYHTCVIHAGTTKLSCWGYNGEGQLGTSGASRSQPLEVSVPPPLLHVATGDRHTCVILKAEAGAGGDVRCFGNNATFQLSGNGATGSAQRVPQLPKRATALALGDGHSCALLVDGTVACWGAGALGQLGNGERLDKEQPVLVPGITDATSIAADENHTCAATPAGLFCWGTDFSGQAGVDAVLTDSTPATVEGL